jgi:TolB-like protein
MKNVLLLQVCLLLVFVFVDCATGQNAPEADELDSAIRAASDYLNTSIPKGNKTAVLNFQSEYPSLSEYVIDELISNMVNDRIFTVVDRANLALARQELNFQTSGEVNDDTAVSIGQMLGAQTIVSGSISRIGGLVRLRVRALDVKTAQIQGQFNRNIPAGGTVAMLIDGAAAVPGGNAGSAAGNDSAAAAQVPAVVAQVPTPARNTAAYKIGDTGPAGGIIFYTKGSALEGWKYLEAAPPETEKQLAFGGIYIGRTEKKVGAGKENTDKFIAELQQHGGGVNTAVWYCDQLETNGFDDWYLPSIDELLYMYNNLYTNAIGGLKSARYCSSTHAYTNGDRGVDFATGEEISVWDTTKYQVRAIRRF